MVRKILFALLMLFMTLWVSAQRFEGGVIAGFNATQVEGDTFKGYNKPGILAGFFVQTDVAPAIFAGMEIKYSQKGSRKRIKQNDPDPKKYIMRLGYIDLPVFAGFRTSDRLSLIHIFRRNPVPLFSLQRNRGLRRRAAAELLRSCPLPAQGLSLIHI